ncbi:MAG: response regulator [Nitrospirae bacterium]|nr:response regulator [Nitrospirota bacterium]
MKNNKIRTRMMVYFGAAFVVTFVAIELAMIYGLPFTGLGGEYKERKTEVLKSVSGLADMKKEQLISLFNERRADSKSLAESEIFRTAAAGKALGRIHQNLVTLKENHEVYEALHLIDAETGRIVASTEAGDVGIDRSRDPDFLAVLNPLAGDSVTIKKSFKSPGIFFYVYSPVRGPRVKIGQGGPVAVLITRSSVDKMISSILHTGRALGTTGEVIFLDQDARILAPLRRPLPDGTLARPLEFIDSSKAAGMAAGGIEGIIEAEDYRGVPVLAVTRHIPVTSEIRWGIVVKTDVQEVFAPLRKDIINAAMITLTGCIMVLLITYLIATKLSGPIKQLSRAAQQVGEGNLDVRVPAEAQDEVGMLAEAFNSMLERIRNYHQDLEDRVAKRTAELNSVNEELRGEMAGRLRAEKEKEKLEEQLRQAQKMEAIGLLAGGVAHDFNNVLMAIIGYSYLLKNRLQDDAGLRSHVEQIIAVSNRAANMVRGLLAFSRKQVLKPMPADLNDIVRNTEKFLKMIIGADIEFTTKYSEKLLTVMVDAGQMDQVLTNLVMNARDAMPQGGVLSIETGIFDLEDEYVKAYLLDNPGVYACISLSDTGSGMDEETRKKIFEPFFTTKGVGEGTGLGLSTVYGIIKQHDGHITVYSEPGRGTTFRIYLPLIEAVAEKEQTPSIASLRGGDETVLLAEDNEHVRTLGRYVLEKYGYRVLIAEDGVEAVNKFNEHIDEIRLCILDVIMPKKSGKDVYDEIKRTRPGVKVLFMSGYTADVLHRKDILGEGLNFITKPVTPETLLKKVREVLDA